MLSTIPPVTNFIGQYARCIANLAVQGIELLLELYILLHPSLEVLIPSSSSRYASLLTFNGYPITLSCTHFLSDTPYFGYE